MILRESQINYKNEEICSVCLDLLVHAQRIDQCGHIFCKRCLIFILQTDSPKCPMCRTRISDSKSVGDIDRQLNLTHPEKYRQRVKEYLKWIDEKSVEFEVGNLVQELPKREAARGKNQFRWTFFVRETTGHTNRYIERMVVQLCPSFRENRFIQIDRAPFQVTAVGWGYFTLTFIIYWKGIFEGAESFDYTLSFFNPKQKEDSQRKDLKSICPQYDQIKFIFQQNLRET